MTALNRAYSFNDPVWYNVKEYESFVHADYSITNLIEVPISVCVRNVSQDIIDVEGTVKVHGKIEVIASVFDNFLKVNRITSLEMSNKTLYINIERELGARPGCDELLHTSIAASDLPPLNNQKT